MANLLRALHFFVVVVVSADDVMNHGGAKFQQRATG